MIAARSKKTPRPASGAGTAQADPRIAAQTAAAEYGAPAVHAVVEVADADGSVAVVPLGGNAAAPPGVGAPA